METRTYTERSNARRAARKAGIDPDLVVETEDGFTLPPAAEELDTFSQSIVERASRIDHAGNGVDTDASADQMRAMHAEAEATPDDLVDTSAPKVDDAIPTFCRLSPEERKAAWERNPPKAAAIKPETATMAKTKTSKRAKAEKPNGADKNTTLLKMLGGKGSTVEAMTTALGWLPHTLRARISRLAKPKSKGGEGLKIERERTEGVTSYRIAS